MAQKLDRRGKPQVLAHVSTYQGNPLEFSRLFFNSPQPGPSQATWLDPRPLDPWPAGLLASALLGAGRLRGVPVSKKSVAERALTADTGFGRLVEAEWADRSSPEFFFPCFFLFIVSSSFFFLLFSSFFFFEVGR